jgi:hypothetical protein
LQDPARLRELSSPEGLPDELTGIVAQIQATNQRLRELETNYQAVDSSLLVLQVRRTAQAHTNPGFQALSRPHRTAVE